MLTGKQRSFLKGLAHNLKPITQIGKEGVSDAFLDQISILLDRHELIKINVLDNSAESADHASRQICEALDAEFVQAIGNKLTIYRQSRIDPTLEIPGADNSRVKVNLQRKNQNKTNRVEVLTKKGGKKSKPLHGKRSSIKAKKEEAEAKEKALEKEKAKTTFKYFSKPGANTSSYDRNTRSLKTTKRG